MRSAELALPVVSPERSAEDPLEWPLRFARRYGRMPRVLHICNVANYAYANARLMRRYDIEADVLDPDFYHIMATPEWYEAEVIGNYGNEFHPDWNNMEVVGGFVRPEWFIQGPRDMAFHYIALRRTGRLRQASRIRQAIEQANNLRAYAENRNALMRRLIGSASPGARLLKSVAKRTLWRLPRLPDQAAADADARLNGDERLIPEVLLSLNGIRQLLTEALGRYDIIQGYTTAAMYPAFLALPNFTAYELGTLRGLPFEDSAMGQLCAWTYRNAPAVLVTNVDCIESAQRLGIKQERIHPVLHAFDCDAALHYTSSDPLPAELAVQPPFFFAPARHHWRDGNESWLKGNDVVIRAAGLLKRAGYDFRIAFVEWGQEIEASKTLIESEDVADRVIWIKPQSRPIVWKIYTHATAVIDQFRAAAFGGVALEAMALGRRLITRYDAKAGEAFFASPPPILEAASDQDVFRHMQAALQDPEDRQGLGLAARAWMKREHSVERQMRAQFAVFARMAS